LQRGGVFGLARPFQKEWTMPGQETVVTRVQDEPGNGRQWRSRWLDRSDRLIVPAAIASLCAVAFTLARWQTDSDRNAGTPFAAPFKALESNLRHISAHPLDQYNVWLLELAILTLFALAALVCLRPTTVPAHERLAFVLYLIEICVVTLNTWNSVDADLRSFIEVYLMAVIILLGTPGNRLRAWLPVLWVILVPALIAVTQRRLALS
jgi:hypothetical protein